MRLDFLMTGTLLRALYSTRAARSRMPPKKAAPAEKKALLGRPSNNLKIGIVGLFAVLPSRRLFTSR